MQTILHCDTCNQSFLPIGAKSESEWRKRHEHPAPVPAPTPEPPATDLPLRALLAVVYELRLPEGAVCRGGEGSWVLFPDARGECSRTPRAVSAEWVEERVREEARNADV